MHMIESSCDYLALGLRLASETSFAVMRWCLTSGVEDTRYVIRYDGGETTMLWILYIVAEHPVATICEKRYHWR